MPSAIRAQVGNNRFFCVSEADTARLTNHGSPPTPMDDWYDLSPIGESRIAGYMSAMSKPSPLLTSAACLLAFLLLAPTAPAQNPAAEEKAIALAQQLKLTPQQEVEVLPILKAEAPKFEAVPEQSFDVRDAENGGTSCHPQRKRASSCRKFLVLSSTNSCRPSAKPTSRRRSRQSAPGADSLTGARRRTGEERNSSVSSVTSCLNRGRAA